MMQHFEIAGLLGVALAVFAYGRVQVRREYAKEMSYSVINLAGMSLLLYSLVYNWNLASFVGNAIWAGISVYGIWRCWSYKRGVKRPKDRKHTTSKASP
jgi:uncharacterized membrane protein YadS